MASDLVYKDNKLIETAVKAEQNYYYDPNNENDYFKMNHDTDQAQYNYEKDQFNQFEDGQIVENHFDEQDIIN